MKIDHNRIRIKATRASAFFLLLAWVMLKEDLGEIADMLYVYEGLRLLHVLVFGTAIYLALLALIFGKIFWLLLFCLVVIISNPVTPLYLGRREYLLVSLFLAVSIHIFRVPIYLRKRRIHKVMAIIVDPQVRSLAEESLKEIKDWDQGNILIKPFEDDITMGISYNVFATLYPEEKGFTIDTRSNRVEWKRFPVRHAGDWEKVRSMVKASYEQSLREEFLVPE